MGGMGKLSDFGGQEPSVELPEIAIAPTSALDEKPEQPVKATKRRPPKKEERLVTVNIKILESQQEWLTDTAKQVRQNNDAPVPASDRVYPQHLIQMAIDLLKSADVDWLEVQNVEQLRKALSL